MENKLSNGNDLRSMMSFLSTAPMRSSSWLDEKRHSFKLLSQKMTAFHEECPRDRKNCDTLFLSGDNLLLSFIRAPHKYANETLG